LTYDLSHTIGVHISCCQAVAKLGKDYKPHVEPIGRNCILL